MRVLLLFAASNTRRFAAPHRWEIVTTIKKCHYSTIRMLVNAPSMKTLSPVEHTLTAQQSLAHRAPTLQLRWRHTPLGGNTWALLD